MVRPKHDAVVFATPEKRLLTLTNSVIPGIAVLHELLKTRTPAELPAVVGFALGAGDEFLLVQFVLDERGQLDRIQCLPRIPQATLARALRSFASLNKVALKGHDRQELAPEQTLLFEAADLRAALARVRAYPRTGDWHGIPLPILQGLGQGAIVLACGAAMGWSGWQYWQSTQGGERLEAQQAALATAQRAIQDIAHQHFDAFTALASVDPIPAVARAQTLAVPGGHVDIDVDRQRGVTLTAHVPLGDDPVHLAMPIAPAAPCVRRDVNVTSTLNELQVTYGCAPHPADIALGGLFSARR